MLTRALQKVLWQTEWRRIETAINAFLLESTEQQKE
jgi:hypothetical protein